MTLLYRYAEMMGYSVEGKADLSSYPDAASISGYAAVPMAWAVGNNVVSGTGEGYLNPGVTASRAQFCRDPLAFLGRDDLSGSVIWNMRKRERLCCSLFSAP